MTTLQAHDYQRFLAMAAKKGIKIQGKGTVKGTGQPCYSVTSSSGESGYIVIVAGASLVCSCAARGYCVHRACVRHEMILAADKAKQLEQEQEADRIAHEILTGHDVYQEPIISRNTPMMPYLPERVRETM
jgi:hypothetical protein